MNSRAGSGRAVPHISAHFSQPCGAPQELCRDQPCGVPAGRAVTPPGTGSTAASNSGKGPQLTPANHTNEAAGRQPGECCLWGCPGSLHTVILLVPWGWLCCENAREQQLVRNGKPCPGDRWPQQPASLLILVTRVVAVGIPW